MRPLSTLAVLICTVAAGLASAKVEITCGPSYRYSAWYDTTVKIWGATVSAPGVVNGRIDSSITLCVWLGKLRDPLGYDEPVIYSVACQLVTPLQWGTGGGLSFCVVHADSERTPLIFGIPRSDIPTATPRREVLSFSYDHVGSRKTQHAVYGGSIGYARLLRPWTKESSYGGSTSYSWGLTLMTGWSDAVGLEAGVGWDPPVFEDRVGKRLSFRFDFTDVLELRKVVDHSWGTNPAGAKPKLSPDSGGGRVVTQANDKDLGKASNGYRVVIQANDKDLGKIVLNALKTAGFANNESYVTASPDDEARVKYGAATRDYIKAMRRLVSTYYSGTLEEKEKFDPDDRDVFLNLP